MPVEPRSGRGHVYVLPRTDDSDLLTVSQLAALLRVSNRTVYRLVNSGQVGAVRIRGQWRIPRDFSINLAQRAP